MALCGKGEGGGSGGGTAAPGNAPRTIPRDEHTVSRKQINSNALKVLYRLHNSGFEAHLVGGGVRDLLLGLEPNDFDVATNATPEEIRSLFRNCRLSGRRFRLAHVRPRGRRGRHLPCRPPFGRRGGRAGT